MFDFGGGTFDISILKVHDNTFEQIVIAGDPELGGRDLDLILRDYCAQEIKERWGRDCLVSKIIAQTLLEKCEEMKISLSSAEDARFVYSISNAIYIEFNRLNDWLNRNIRKAYFDNKIPEKFMLISRDIIQIRYYQKYKLPIVLENLGLGI